MRDRDKLRRVKRANEVQSETLDEYRNTIKFLELKLLRLENEIEQAKEMEKKQMFDYIEKNYVNGENSLKFHQEEFEKYYNETFNKE